jgi:rfaE bifunctional protein nucleotidyltransferase chain/domain
MLIGESDSKMSSKIKTREELKSEICRARRQGKKIVTTNGCFDILHVGHLRYLQKAKELGDILVVAINSDDSVRAIKGDKRPLVSEDERAEILAALECVDYVTIFSELDPIRLLRELRPDIHVKGGDYSLDQVIEREAVESLGAELHLIPGVPGKSTSRLIKLIVERYGS